MPFHRIQYNQISKWIKFRMGRPKPLPAQVRSRSLLLAFCLGINLCAWFFLYSKFIAGYFYVDNHFLWPLLLLQWIPAWLAAFLAMTRFSRQGTIYGVLAMALLLWPVADVLEQLSNSQNAGILLLAGHVVHLLSYGVAFWVVFLFIPVAPASFGRLRYQIDVLIHAASWGLLLWVLLLAPILSPMLESNRDLIWLAIYAILDLIILMLFVWLQGQTQNVNRKIWFLAAGYFLFSAYDLATGWISQQTETISYVWLGFLPIAGYGLMAWVITLPGSIQVSESNKKTESIIPTSLRGRWQRMEERWLPIASTIAIVTLLLAQWNRSGNMDPALTGCAVGLCLLLFLREGVIAGQAELAGYRVLLENLADPACICLEDGKIVLENPVLRGWGGGLLSERNIRRVLPMEPSWDSILRSAQDGAWEGEVQLSLSMQMKKPAWLVIRPLPGEQGAPTRMACLFHDLSPQVKQEDALREAVRRAEEAQASLQLLSTRLEERVREQTSDLTSAMGQLEEQNRQLLSLDRMKSEFVALTSHEMRTPLAGIRAGVELALLRTPPLPKKTRDNLALVLREAERLGRFVEDVLDLSALEAGKLPMQIGPMSVLEAWHQARSALALAHSGKEQEDLLRLEVDLQEELPEVMADAHILASVLFQLVENAIKYAPRGKIFIGGTQINAATVEIEVRDEGPGIAAADRNRLFVSFSRLVSADSPRTQGIGLGLYLSRRMTEAMGGRLESPISESGLILHIHLPIFVEPE
jgi:signal transduction histidine kinase